MKKIASTSLYKRFRFPPEIIRHCVWLYFRFSLSFRDIEELMAERGIVLTYETIRQWGLKFGQAYANELKRHRGKTGDQWHLDEVFLKINGKQHSLWRAVDQHGNVLDILVQSRAFQESREKVLPQIAQRPPVRAASDHHRQTDQLRCCQKEVMSSVEHRLPKGLNNGAENSHPPTRQRERTMRRFKSPGHAQRFLSAFGPILDHFRPKRHRFRASEYRALMQGRFQVWNEVIGRKTAA